VADIFVCIINVKCLDFTSNESAVYIMLVVVPLNDEVVNQFIFMEYNMIYDGL
jgi:hypothetical protein